jgi:methyl-accepting chemotaxis protein
MAMTDKLTLKLKVILFIASILLIVFTSISLSNYFTSQKGTLNRIKQQELPVYIDNIYNSIQVKIWKDIMVSDVVSNNYYLMEWIKSNEGTGENEKLISFLKLINNRYSLAQQNASTAEKLTANAELFEKHAEKLKETISFFKL